VDSGTTKGVEKGPSSGKWLKRTLSTQGHDFDESKGGIPMGRDMITRGGREASSDISTRTEDPQRQYC